METVSRSIQHSAKATVRSVGHVEDPPPVVQRTEGGAAEIVREARAVRGDIVETLFRTGGGHYGGSLSVVEILLALYRTQLRVSPTHPFHAQRDRLILSKGHAAVALYAVLRRVGFFDTPLDGYARFDSPLEGHPDMTSVTGVDFSTGSLGQGLSVGLGMALGLSPSQRNVWVVLGDGECQEGQVWEAAMLAASCRVKNLFAIVDSNRYQEWGRRGSDEEDCPAPVPDLAAKWRAFGWHAIECDGHDVAALVRAMEAARAHTGGPTAILADTRKGKGIPMAEADPTRFHCTDVDFEEHQVMIGCLTS